MTTYVYETLPANGEKPRRFEVLQRMSDEPLRTHPDTGEPVRRVISGGYGLMGVAQKTESSAASGGQYGGCCGGSCGCG